MIKSKKRKYFFLFKEFSPFFFNRSSTNGKENLSLWLSAHWGLVPQWGCKLQIRNINTNKQPHLWSIKAFQPLKQCYFCCILPLPNFKGIIKGNCYADRISSRHNQNKQLTWTANFQKENPAMALLPILFIPQLQKTRHTAAAASRFMVHRWGGRWELSQRHKSLPQDIWSPDSRRSSESDLVWLLLVPHFSLFLHCRSDLFLVPQLPLKGCSAVSLNPALYTTENSYAPTYFSLCYRQAYYFTKHLDHSGNLW